MYKKGHFVYIKKPADIGRHLAGHKPYSYPMNLVLRNWLELVAIKNPLGCVMCPWGFSQPAMECL